MSETLTTKYLSELNSIWEKLCELTCVPKSMQLIVTTGIFHTEREAREEAFDFLLVRGHELMTDESPELKTIGKTLIAIVNELEKL